VESQDDDFSAAAHAVGARLRLKAMHQHQGMDDG
jgi:hypothetical protein